MKQDWARKAAEKYANCATMFDDIMDLRFAAKLLRAERARARRVVRELKKKLKERQFHPDIAYGYQVACDELLRRLK